MTESSDSSDRSQPQSQEVVEQVRTQEPGAPFGADEGEGANPNVASDETLADADPDDDVDPGAGGYAGRDPKTDMPRMPTVAATQDDPKSHDAQPPDREPDASGG